MLGRECISPHQNVACGKRGRGLEKESRNRCVEGIDGSTDAQWLMSHDLHKA